MKRNLIIPLTALVLALASCDFSPVPSGMPTRPKTSTPTTAPTTSNPTSAQTSDPTVGPTAESTNVSTSAPTSDPTSASSNPTSNPTSEPTSQPTSAPTSDSTSASTSSPTSNPSSSSSTSSSTPEVVHVESVFFPYESIDLEVGKSVTLNPTVLPAEADDKTLSWSSSNSSIVSVADGLVTANVEGEANIIVTTNDGGLTATCKVNAYIDDDEDPYVPDPTDEGILIITSVAEGEETTLERDYKQIYVNAPDAAVVINMNGHTVENSENSPIYVVDCDSIDISATKNTESFIKDTRPIYEGEVAGQGKGAVYVDSGDLTLKGKGTLNIISSHYNGVHAKKDVKIKNLTLNVTAPNHAIKGKDSVTVESGTINLSCGGDGLHSDDSDLSSKEKQRGNVTVSGGTLTINSMGDAIAAAYNAVIEAADESNAPTIVAKTNKYSSYSGETVDPSETKLYLKMNSSTYASGSYTYAAYMNGVWYKASFKSSQETSSGGDGGPGGGGSPWGGGGSTSTTYYYYEIDKPAGATSFTLYRFAGSDVTSFDVSSANASSDVTTFNTNYDTITVSVSGSKISLSSWSTYTSGNSRTANLSAKGIKAENEVYISGGSINIKAHDDGIHANNDGLIENGTPLGNVHISGGSTEIYSSDDGIHADYILDISGGEVNVTSSYEGLEGNVIQISGGTTYAYATNDGMNAGSGKATSSITVSGGYLDIQVPSSGDTDGIDSNGTYTQTGGVVIVAGPGSASGSGGGGSFALDSESTVSLRGGTIAVFGGIERTPSTSGVTRTLCSSSTVSSGNHTISFSSNSYTTNLKSSTRGCVVYSDQGSASLS